MKLTSVIYLIAWTIGCFTFGTLVSESYKVSEWNTAGAIVLGLVWFFGAVFMILIDKAQRVYESACSVRKKHYDEFLMKRAERRGDEVSMKDFINTSLEQRRQAKKDRLK